MDASIEAMIDRRVDTRVREVIAELNTITPKYMRPKQAAIFLGCSVKQHEHWRYAGTGPKYHKPWKKLVLYARTDLDLFVREGGAS